MSTYVDLTPEEEAQLRAWARQRGERPEELAGEMVRSLLLSPSIDPESGLAPVTDSAGVFHADRWERVLASIATTSRGFPSLPADAVSREAIYAQHD